MFVRCSACCEALVLCDIGAVSLSQIQQPVTRNNAAVLEQILLAATAQSLRGQAFEVRDHPR